MIFHVVILTLFQGCYIVTTESVSWTYKVIEADLDWEEARIFCQQNATELALIKSYKSDAKLKKIVKDYENLTECLWIGMLYRPNETVFKWLDGGVTENIPWATSEPNCETGSDRNCLQGEEHCVAMNPTLPNKSSFLTYSCNQKVCMALCQKQYDPDNVTITVPALTTPSTVVPMTTTETTTKTTTTLFDSSNRNIFYHLHETLEGVRSDEALPLCNSLDMNIATIKSVLIYNSVKDYLGGIDMGSRCMWIGLYWKLETLRHEWEDGEPLTWAQWYNKNPSCMKPTNDIRCNGIERNCVSFTQAFNFRTKDCNGVCNVLCESNRSSTVITTSNNKLTSATPTEELSTTTELEVTKIISASPALKTLWTVGTWSYQYIQLDHEVVNWTQALQLCKGRNMDILMIKDEGRLEIIKDIIQYLQLNGINNTGYWIGMVWNENIQKHKWLDNNTVTWTNWANEEPKCMAGWNTIWSLECLGKIKDCVVSDGSFFRTRNCSNLHKVICQQYIHMVGAPTYEKEVETRPKVLNCKCSMRKINKKWHFLDGANISETKVENLVQKDFEDNVKGNISVNKKSLSSVIQKKNSIDDKRPESKAIGWSATLFVAIPVSFIILVDVIDMVKYLQKRN